MSLGGGLVRTTCSSEGVGGPGRSSSEGLLDSVYPRTYPALMKVAQMVSKNRGAQRDPGTRVPQDAESTRDGWVCCWVESLQSLTM